MRNSLLQTKQESDFVVTDKKISEITSEPVRVDFAYEQTDGWYSSTVTNTAWVYKNEKGKIRRFVAGLHSFRVHGGLEYE